MLNHLIVNPDLELPTVQYLFFFSNKTLWCTSTTSEIQQLQTFFILCTALVPQGPKLRIMQIHVIGFSSYLPQSCIRLWQFLLRAPAAAQLTLVGTSSLSWWKNVFKKKIFIASACIGEHGIVISVICMSRIDHNIIMHTSSLPDLTQCVLTANFIIYCGFTVALIEESFYRFMLHLHFDFQHWAPNFV